MPEIKKTNPDPLKFGPDSGLYGLQRTSDTKSMKTKRLAKFCRIFIQ